MNDTPTGHSASASSSVRADPATDHHPAPDRSDDAGTPGVPAVQTDQGQYAVELYTPGYDDGQYGEQQLAYPVAASIVPQPFEIVLRGYHRRQVDRFINDVQAVVQDLETRLVQVSAEADWVREELTRNQQDLEQLRQELEAARQAAVPRTPQAELSERMHQILALANEEATQQRTRAEAEAREVVDAAQERATVLLDQARAEAETVVAEARARAEAEVLASREESQRILGASAEESDRMVAVARERVETADRELRRREARMSDLETNRVGQLVSAHGEVLRRLAGIRESLGEILVREQENGAVDAALTGALVTDERPAPRGELHPGPEAEPAPQDEPDPAAAHPEAEPAPEGEPDAAAAHPEAEPAPEDTQRVVAEPTEVIQPVEPTEVLEPLADDDGSAAGSDRAPSGRTSGRAKASRR
jgi:cell division septum initiation protein DivIVA